MCVCERLRCCALPDTRDILTICAERRDVLVRHDVLEFRAGLTPRPVCESN